MSNVEEPAKKPWYKRPRYVIPLVIVLALLAFSLIPLPTAKVAPDQKAINDAVGYFTSSYVVGAGLVPETTNGSVFFLYPDNYLASVALHRYSSSNQSTDDFAESLYYAVNGYLSTSPSSLFQSPYAVLNSTFGSSIGFGCMQNFTLGWVGNGTLVTTKGHYQIGTVSIQQGKVCPTGNHADQLFLEAIYTYKEGNASGGLSLLAAGRADFDGKGLADEAFKSGSSPSFGEYQTYKLALYAYADVCMGQSASDPNFPAVNSTLVRMQDKSTGGFYTSYNADLGHGGSTDTMTTALAMMALEEIVNPSIGC